MQFPYQIHLDTRLVDLNKHCNYYMSKQNKMVQWLLVPLYFASS